MVGGDLGVPSNPTIVISLLPADAQLCLWNIAPALEFFRELSPVHKYEKLVCCRYTTGALAIVGHGEIYAKARAAISASISQRQE